MANPPQDDSHGTIETEERTLPEPTRAPSEELTRALSDEEEMLSEEELDRRQAAIKTRRKPSGPPENLSRAHAEEDTAPADVPETIAAEADDDEEER